jgi:hypothetical protein
MAALEGMLEEKAVAAERHTIGTLEGIETVQ